MELSDLMTGGAGGDSDALTKALQALLGATPDTSINTSPPPPDAARDASGLNDMAELNNYGVGGHTPVAEGKPPSLFQRLLHGLGAGVNATKTSFEDAFAHVPSAYAGMLSPDDLQAAKNRMLMQMGGELMGANAPPGTNGVPIGIAMTKGALGAGADFQQNLRQMLQDQSSAHALQTQLGEQSTMDAIAKKYPPKLGADGKESREDMLSRAENMGIAALMAGYPDLGGKYAALAKSIRDGRANVDRHGWMSIGGDAFNTLTGQWSRGPSSIARTTIAEGTLQAKWAGLAQAGNKAAADAYQRAYAAAVAGVPYTDPESGVSVPTLRAGVKDPVHAAQTADDLMKQFYPKEWARIHAAQSNDPRAAAIRAAHPDATDEEIQQSLDESPSP